MMNYELDTLDRKILSTLDHDARISISELARSLRQSRETIDYRINRLESARVITGYHAEVDPLALGYSIYKIYLRLSGSPHAHEKLLRELRDHQEVFWIAPCSGRWDLIFALWARSAEDLHASYLKLIGKFHAVVLESSIAVFVQGLILSKRYLWRGEQREIPLALTSSKPVFRCDSLDQAIIRHLTHRARTALSTIADATATSAAVIQYRLERLLSSGVLLGFRVALDYARIGIDVFKAQVFLGQIRPAEYSRLLSYCAEHPCITFVIQQIGSCILELEVEAPGTAGYEAVANDLRERFPKLIRNIETMLMKHGSRTWMPERLVQGGELGT